jgi:hypothetical protein
MLTVQRPHGRHHGRRQHSRLADIEAHPGLQRRHRVALRAPRRVVPALDGRPAEAQRQPSARVLPGLHCQFLQGRLQLARRWRGGQQRTDDRKAQPRPALPLQRVASNAHGGSGDGQRNLRHLNCHSLQTAVRLGDHHLLRDAATDYWPSVTVLNGARNRSAWRSWQPGSVAVNRASRSAGNTTSGGRKSPRCACQNGVRGKLSDHHARQRSSVARGTPSCADSARRPTPRQRPQQGRTEHHRRPEINAPPKIEHRERGVRRCRQRAPGCVSVGGGNMIASETLRKRTMCENVCKKCFVSH